MDLISTGINISHTDLCKRKKNRLNTVTASYDLKSSTPKHTKKNGWTNMNILYQQKKIFKNKVYAL